ELLRKREVTLAVAPLRLGPHEGHRADRAAVRQERDDDDGANVQIERDLEMLFVARPGADHRFADLGINLRLAGAKDVRDAARRARIRWIFAPELPRPLHLRRIDV